MSLGELLACWGVKTAHVETALVRADALERVVARLSCETFVAQCPHPWLVRPLDLGERVPVLYRTAGDGVEVSVGVSGVEALIPRLRGDASAFACHALVKCGSNPWTDRILLGRAPNNDVVLRDRWISKLHAWFEQRDGGWHVFDARSANGTCANGEHVASDAGVELRSGAELRFGRIRCLFLESRELFGALQST